MRNVERFIARVKTPEFKAECVKRGLDPQEQLMAKINSHSIYKVAYVCATETNASVIIDALK